MVYHLELAVMVEDVWSWHYELKSAQRLNSVSKRICHHGALIRCGDGFGCVHPWPELGDLPLQDQLKSIAAGQPTKLAAISMKCAREDAVARQQGISLFRTDGGSGIPPSHWLYREGDSIEAIHSHGFSTVKIKVGPLLSNSGLIDELAGAGLRIRLDANGSFTFSDFCDWWDRLSEAAKAGIEFIEDPVPWNERHWSNLIESGIPLAIDRGVEGRRAIVTRAILKPAINDDEGLVAWLVAGERKVSVTSYMDHPLGQMWAAFRARELYQQNPEMMTQCGLLTHRCFESNEFSECIEVVGNVLQAPQGTGLGFDELLKQLPWKRLI